MLSDYVGEDRFLKGVSIYLKKRLYGNSVTKDLWDGIGEATSKSYNTISQYMTLTANRHWHSQDHGELGLKSRIVCIQCKISLLIHSTYIDRLSCFDCDGEQGRHPSTSGPLPRNWTRRAEGQRDYMVSCDLLTRSAIHWRQMLQEYPFEFTHSRRKRQVFGRQVNSPRFEGSNDQDRYHEAIQA